MKYTAQDESQVANIALSECYICHETLIKDCILSYKCFKYFIVFYTYQSVIKIQFFGHLNMFIDNFLLIKCVNDLAFYNYPTNIIAVIKLLNPLIRLCKIRKLHNYYIYIYIYIYTYIYYMVTYQQANRAYISYVNLVFKFCSVFFHVI